ncbi:predicted protein [Histoplasma capsulatum G186AR]|uniref:Uncharacterized protein n=1 Tax=Ajellomyces capsulatus (strain G186AR / H82 / ATCC MYA-2454 / RMSCC 2432) TaxID=447093 RepID=C0ND10_AJECG|nr:uncharacterized protein HCBG_01006 [Histoplasma capsulatum G186AR]EEH11551.1 predicted protein [Histoplasma capsulatum G186AR]
MSDQNILRARETFATILSYYENRSNSSSDYSTSLPPPDWARSARSSEYGNIIIGYIQPRPPTAEQAAQAQQYLSDLLRSQETRNSLSPTERQLFTAAVSEPISLVNRRPPNPAPSNTPPSTTFVLSPRPSNQPPPSTYQSTAFPPSPHPPNPPPCNTDPSSLRESHPPSMTPPSASPRATTESDTR